MKFHLANFMLMASRPAPWSESSVVARYDGIFRVTLEGPWLIIEDSAGDEVLLATSYPVTIRPIR